MHFRMSHQSQCGLYQKTKSHCLSENKMLSTLIWRHVSLLYVVQSNILWLTILLSYHYRCNVVISSFLLTVHRNPKKLNQIITVNSSTNTPITKKITLARFACLCFDMCRSQTETVSRVRTGPGKPGKSWNFIMAFSRMGKSWKKATIP